MRVRGQVNALFAEALLPAPYRRPTDAGSLGDLEHRQALGRHQDDARPQHMLQRSRPIANNLGKPYTISFVKENTSSLSHRPDSHARSRL